MANADSLYSRAHVSMDNLPAMRSLLYYQKAIDALASNDTASLARKTQILSEMGDLLATQMLYREAIDKIIGLTYLSELPNIRYNYGYFPIFVDEAKYGMSRDALYEKLKANNIFGRRYFYPIISTLNPYKEYPSATPSNLPIATKMADQVLCLPMHHELTESEVESIINCIQK